MPGTNDENRDGRRSAAWLRERLRWQRPRAARVRPSRWTAWAEHLTERLARTGAYFQHPGMVLARPLVEVRRAADRWVLRASYFQPKIHLAIQPLLRETLVVWAASSGSQDAAARTAGPRAVVAAAGRPLPVAQPLALVFARAAAGRTIGSRAAPGARPMDGALAVFPMERILRRGSMPNAAEEAGPASRMILMNRILGRTERREQTDAPSTRTLQKASRPADATPTRPALLPELAEAAIAQAKRAGWPQGPAAIPPVNVDALAEQVLQRIDRRVTAWRERSGQR
jgi:hypothetical protein